MFRLKLLVMFFVLGIAGNLFCQQAKSLSLSPVFANIPGTPRVVRNESQNIWLVVWRQGSPGKILGRIVRSDGKLGPQKVLASAVSQTSDSFDILYDSLSSTYVLAFETVRGLEVQVFNANLVKQGTSVVIENGATGTHAALSHDPIGNRFFLFWLAVRDGLEGKMLKIRTLDSSGKPTDQARVLVQAAADKKFGGLDVARNPKNGNLMVMMLELTPSGTGSVIGYTVKSNGTLVHPTRRFQPPTAGLLTHPEASFSDGGTGFAIWSDRNFIKFRKISLVGGFASGTKSIPNAADVNSQQTAIAYDSKNNQFVSAWVQGKQIKTMRLNPTTGAVSQQPLTIAGSLLNHSRNVRLAGSKQDGKFLAVWEDATLDASVPSGTLLRSRIRAALFGGSGSGSSGEIIVHLVGLDFVPPEITIHSGTVVKWINDDPSHRHTVTSEGSTNGSLFDAGVGGGGNNSFSFRFAQPGSFPYICRIHIDLGMRGKITVVP
jgi:plastocyanin